MSSLSFRWFVSALAALPLGAAAGPACAREVWLDTSLGAMIIALDDVAIYAARVDLLEVRVRC